MARGDIKGASALVTDDVEWIQIGRKPLVGVGAFCKAFARYASVSALTIEHVISHGKSGAVNGVVEFGGKRRAFCHMYEFASAKGSAVKALASYSIALK
jgi:ketosteroid isomerase-like protein